MPSTEHYRTLISEIPCGTERKVYQVLCNHVGENHAISLRDLAVLTFGHPTEYRLINGEKVYNFDDVERKTRKVIETLRREYRIPVMANSGKAGRWLAADPDELEKTITEMVNRAHNILAVAQELRQAHIPAPDPWSYNQQPVSQDALFNVNLCNV